MRICQWNSLVGRALRNNLFNLGVEKGAKEFLSENNFSSMKFTIWNQIRPRNGGLESSAFIYLDALTSNEYPVEDSQFFTNMGFSNKSSQMDGNKNSQINGWILENMA